MFKGYLGSLSAAALILTVGSASADCAAKLDEILSGGNTVGIAKDGTMAPLEEGEGSSLGADESVDGTAEGVAKDGTAAPLEAPADLATSSQDVEAQQKGDPTAADVAQGSQANGEQSSESNAEAIDTARAALAAGDEAGCLAALATISE